MHPVLARDTTLVKYDLKRPPREVIFRDIYERHKTELATRRPTYFMRLISKDMPWSIDIDFRREASKQGGYGYGYVAYAVNVGDIWKTLYSAMQEPLRDSEWALLLDSSWSEREARRRNIEQAGSKRTIEGGKGSFVRRLDWLGDKTVFRGLTKDDELARRRLMPGMQWCEDTWVVRFDRSN